MAPGLAHCSHCFGLLNCCNIMHKTRNRVQHGKVSNLFAASSTEAIFNWVSILRPFLPIFTKILTLSHCSSFCHLTANYLRGLPFKESGSWDMSGCCLNKSVCRIDRSRDMLQQLSEFNRHRYSCLEKNIIDRKNGIEERWQFIVSEQVMKKQ